MDVEGVEEVGLIKELSKDVEEVLYCKFLAWQMRCLLFSVLSTVHLLVQKCPREGENE